MNDMTAMGPSLRGQLVMSDTGATKPDGVIHSSFGLLDVILLLALWGLVLGSSVLSLGIAAPAAFLVVTMVLVLRNPTNGLLVLLLVFYTPAVTVGVPNIFSVVVALTLGLTVVLNPASLGRLLLSSSQVLFTAMAFVLFGAVQMVLSDNMTLALPYFMKYLEGVVLLGILVLTVKTRVDLGRVLMWWAIVAGLATIVKTIHILLGDNTVLYRMMEAKLFHDQFGLEDRINIRHGGEIGRRFLLPGEEPNYISTGLVFPLALALAFHHGSKGMGKLFWTGIACMTAIGCVGTYSRSGFLATALVVGFYLLRGNLVKGIVPVGVFAGAFSMAVMLIPALNKRIFGIGDAVNEGATGRFTLWKQALAMWFDSPVFGNGMSAFYDRYHGAVHNSYLQVLAETGVVGFALYLSVIIVAIQAGRKLRMGTAVAGESNDIHLSRIALSGLFGFCFMIATVTYQDVKLFWLALGAYSAIYFVGHATNRVEPSPGSC
ncbi:O-antigen ligase family protein [uncultured Nitrospira sp.]|uniref:O-antigen ligase family protein n=1 Tax=uncultured Nitrospira sp. TaxID=157176 RepID=UPI0031401DE8